jgi:hypothetical protein
MVINLALGSGITLVAMIPGTAQAKLEIRGMTDFPDSPKFRIIFSTMKAVRDKYPESSKMMMKQKRIRI